MATKNHVIKIDRTKSILAQPYAGHNRWHPDIPPIVSVNPGDIVVIECLDGLDGQLSRNSTHEDVKNLSFTRCHPLTGPIFVNGAEPGDILEIEIIDVRSSEYGVAVIVPGFGFLREYFPSTFVSHWKIDGHSAISEDIPGVRIFGNPFMGVMGVAPSKPLMEKIVLRESELFDRTGQISTCMPDPKEAVPGIEPIASNGLRTISPQEYGGNIDTKSLTKGTTVRIPVFVRGALFSTGDGHFAQGDGEVCGTAIETANTLTVKFGIRKGVMRKHNIDRVEFERSSCNTSQAQEIATEFYATTGMPITSEGRIQFENLNVAAQNALLNMIDYLMIHKGYNREQAYVLCSIAVDLRITQCVDVPNVMVSAYLPMDIFIR